MDFVNTMLVTLPQPTGFWESILNAFKGINGTYILAVIFIAVLIRFVFAFVDIINKKVSMKSNEINAKMKPELDAIKQKYQNDPNKLRQKTDEVYKKYQFNVMGSCFPMLIMLVLQTVVFLTLWNSLQTVSNYNIASQYNDMKNIYANVLYVNDKLDQAISESEGSIVVDENSVIEIKIDVNEQNQKCIVYSVFTNSENLNEATLTDSFVFTTDWTNRDIFDLVSKYVPPAEEEELEPEEKTEGDQGAEEEENPYVAPAFEESAFRDKIQAEAERLVKEYYLNTQEGFLWIKNIYKPDAPQSPMFTESEIKSYLSHYYTAEESQDESKYQFEGKIFNKVTAGIDRQALGNNGYYILTILAVIFSLFSMWLSNFMMRRKDQPKQKQPIAMYIIMPLIFGLFTFMYTSLFAIYLVVGQLASIATTPLTTWIVKKWTTSSNNKKKEKDVVEVDYRRK